MAMLGAVAGLCVWATFCAVADAPLGSSPGPPRNEADDATIGDERHCVLAGPVAMMVLARMVPQAPGPFAGHFCGTPEGAWTTDDSRACA